MHLNVDVCCCDQFYPFLSTNYIYLRTNRFFYESTPMYFSL
jgi:hypothetical protein